MAYPQQSRQFHYVTVPRAFGASGPTGQVAVASVGASVQIVDLYKLTFGVNQTFENAQGLSTIMGQGVTGDYITIEADGQDIGLIFGPSIASVTGANAPNLSTQGTLNASGIYTGASGTCFRLFAGTAIRVLPNPGPAQNSGDTVVGQYGGDRFLAMITGGTSGTVRLYQSSPENP